LLQQKRFKESLNGSINKTPDGPFGRKGPLKPMKMSTAGENYNSLKVNLELS